MRKYLITLLLFSGIAFADNFTINPGQTYTVQVNDYSNDTTSVQYQFNGNISIILNS
jgi:hypothetical protein